MMKTTNQTMYDAAFEKDACGMGFIAQKNGHYSRELVQNALTMLERMNHRGEQALNLTRGRSRNLDGDARSFFSSGQRGRNPIA